MLEDSLVLDFSTFVTFPQRQLSFHFWINREVVTFLVGLHDPLLEFRDAILEQRLPAKTFRGY